MPELPDVEVYREALDHRIAGTVLQRIRIRSPFLLRSIQPQPKDLEHKKVRTVSRLGKRIVLELEDDLFAVIHLMVAGRLRWSAPGAHPPGRIGLAAFDFDVGTLLLTEAGSRKRASMHLAQGKPALRQLDPGGIEPLEATASQFAAALQRENHTLKRSLTDPHLFSGIGNAYSDEILHRARMSPFKQTSRLTDEEIERLHQATQDVLKEWLTRLRTEAGNDFPKKVTAFRKEMAVHGRYAKPCPACSTPVQRIVYAENEANYCAKCQTGGKLLADRALSRLLRSDWPKTLEELEERKRS